MVLIASSGQDHFCIISPFSTRAATDILKAHVLITLCTLSPDSIAQRYLRSLLVCVLLLSLYYTIYLINVDIDYLSILLPPFISMASRIYEVLSQSAPWLQQKVLDIKFLFFSHAYQIVS